MANVLCGLGTELTAATCARRVVWQVAIVFAGTVILNAGTSLASVTVSPSIGTSLEMQGDYVLTGISNNGTLGVGGNTSPGFVFDRFFNNLA